MILNMIFTHFSFLNITYEIDHSIVVVILFCETSEDISIKGLRYKQYKF